jgi:hypothetical protein
MCQYIKTKEDIYGEVIDLLNTMEIIVTDEKEFEYIRKHLLDIANDVLRSGDVNE